MTRYPRKGNLTGNRYGNENQLEIRNKLDARCYEIHCTVCSLDHELHGTACYKLSSGDINKGIIPCGCSINPRWKPWQKEILIKREVSKHGKVALPRNQNDFRKVNLVCLLHGKEFKSNYYNIRKGKNLCCKDCLFEMKREALTPDLYKCTDTLQDVQPNLQIVGKDFDRKGMVVMCDICSEDQLVQDGLCSGLFTKSFSSMKRGEKPCRCQKQYSYTVPQRVRLIEYVLEDSGLDYEFVQAYKRLESHGEEKYLSDWGKFYCKTHGVFHRSLSRMWRLKQGCPTCELKFGGFNEKKTSVFYILRILGRETDFVKFGISGQFHKRLVDHKTNLKKSGFSIESIETYSLSGSNARQLEGYVKNKFDSIHIDVDGFKTESIDIKNYNNLKNFVDKYLDKIK